MCGSEAIVFIAFCSIMGFGLLGGICWLIYDSLVLDPIYNIKHSLKINIIDLEKRIKHLEESSATKSVKRKK